MFLVPILCKILGFSFFISPSNILVPKLLKISVFSLIEMVLHNVCPEVLRTPIFKKFKGPKCSMVKYKE